MSTGISLTQSQGRQKNPGQKDGTDCQCSFSSRCCHILSVMMAIGFGPGEDKKAINLTQLRKNSRVRKHKRTGTKRGRKGDVDNTSVIAAPDSILMNNTIQDDDLSFAHDPSDKASLSHSTSKAVKIKFTDSEENDKAILSMCIALLYRHHKPQTHQK